MDLTPRLDLYSIFIFLGIVQGAFLLFFFLTGENRKIHSNVFHGLMLFSIVLCLFEIFISYTGYIIHCLYLVDFSEAASLLIGPAFYLLVLSHAGRIITWRQYLHLVFPFIYLMLQLPTLLQSDDIKYNAWVYSYHPDWQYRDVGGHVHGRMFLITDHATEITIISLALYVILAGIEIRRAFVTRKEPFFTTTNSALKFLRWELIQLVAATAGIVIVKMFNRHDTGDHYFSFYIALTIYFTSFRIISDSGFFKRPSLAEPIRYKNSSVSTESQESTVRNLQELMRSRKPYLQSEFSLPALAKELNTSVHHLSQVINETLGKSFFEMMAEYRVKEAQELIRTNPHIKIEEIAEQVGYNSKSSFNTAFKKQTGVTPSEFRAGKSRL